MSTWYNWEEEMNNVTRRAIALKNARDNAQNTEFKQMWNQKLKELITQAELGMKIPGVSIH